MENIVLTNMDFSLDLEKVCEKMRVKEGSSYKKRLEKIVEEAQEHANLKAIYNVMPIEDRGDNFIIVEGVKFTSQIMGINLEGLNRIFPFVVTCGIELKKWADSKTDMLEIFWADSIKEMALETGHEILKKDIQERFNPGNMGEMNPGSLQDWPIQEQRPLFDLLGNVEEKIGVNLMESFTMVPKKSVSGIFFASESGYSNCELCPMKNCPTRKMPYNESLYTERYART